jgi:hypothetical protein
MKKLLIILLLLTFSCIEENIDGYIYKKYEIPSFTCIECVVSRGSCWDYRRVEFKNEYVIKIADDSTKTIRKFYVSQTYYNNIKINDVVKCTKCFEAGNYRTERFFYKEHISQSTYEELLPIYPKCDIITSVINQ